MARLTESVVEEAALAWLESVGWSVKHGVEIAPGEPAAERTTTARSCWRNGFAMRWRGSTWRSPPRRWKTPSAS